MHNKKYQDHPFRPRGLRGLEGVVTKSKQESHCEKEPRVKQAKNNREKTKNENPRMSTYNTQ